MIEEVEDKFINKVVDYLNKRVNKSKYPGKNFDLYQSVWSMQHRVFTEIENAFNVDVDSEIFNIIIKRWVRDNYGNGMLALPGDTIRLISMPDDPNPIESGTVGEVIEVSSVYMFAEDHLKVLWENGRTLNLIVGVDEFEVIQRGSGSEREDFMDYEDKDY